MQNNPRTPVCHARNADNLALFFCQKANSFGIGINEKMFHNFKRPLAASLNFALYI